MYKISLFILIFFLFSCSESNSDDDSPKCTSIPTLLTFEVSNLTDSSVDLSGSIEAPTCDPTVTSQGFVYGLNAFPKTSDQIIEVSGVNVFKALTGLDQNTTYYYRTFFTNLSGTYYGNQISFKTLETPNPVYLENNGVTIKAKEWAKIGDVGVVNGIEYKIVDRQELTIMILGSEDVSRVCTSLISDMSGILNYRDSFNMDISSWDVSNVTNMNEMFLEARAFNQDLSYWDVSNVVDMNRMFNNAFSFSSNLSNWDVSKVTNMEMMFSGAERFNSDLSSWNVGNVTNMRSMFAGARWFNSDLSSWDVSNVTNCSNFSTQNFAWTLPKPIFTNCN